MQITIDTKVGNRGWEVQNILLESAALPAKAQEYSLTHISGNKTVKTRIKSVTQVETSTCLEIEPFSYHYDFKLTITSDSDSFSLSKQDVTDIRVSDLDKFEACMAGDVRYRLYSPKASGPRPLLLFLHGGGECGYDNLMQMTGTLGALKLAESYPDLYVMAPQAPGVLSEMLPDPSAVFQSRFETAALPEKAGWHREYLASVCDLIRQMITEGKVDARRIFVTGMSLGGAGTLRMLSVGSGMFAAAAPICPTMTPETYQILTSLTNQKIWISTAYMDHTVYRHKYITDGIMQLKEQGNKHAHLTLYAPEELERYGFSADPDMSFEEKLLDNHNSWVPTLNNEYGIMDWLISQHQ